MNEIKSEVKVFMSKLVCNCGGNMKYTGTVLPTNPKEYMHQCEECNKCENIVGKKYPLIEYIEK